MNQSITELITPIAFTGQTYWVLIALLLPLCSFLMISLFSKWLPRQGDFLALGSISASFFISIYLLIELGQAATPAHVRMDWINLSTGAFPMSLSVGLKLDMLAAMMITLITGIGLLVHVFSLSYMKGDPNYGRYWAFLGLFCFSMLGLVLADNLLLIFMFWEGVGLSSYFLIGFWNQKDVAARAAQKAFIVNKIGDAGFLAGILALFSMFGTLDLDALSVLFSESTFEQGIWQSNILLEDGKMFHATLSIEYVSFIGICLFLGIAAKSAQFPLQIWLPDAMEGPTPVSALIHAATMVAAGVYLLARVFIFMTDEVLLFIAFIGAITAFMAAIAALSQWDIKRVLAFSTISQLGYMVMGMGVGAYDMALFHLFTHAFFKAGLFLSAGIVIHQMAHSGQQYVNLGFIPPEQDLHNMGGFRKSMPKTFVLYLISMLSLAGIPFFSGFLSKDGILLAAVEKASFLGGSAWLIPVLGFITACLTALYMARHAMLIFGGKVRAGNMPKDPGVLMLFPVLILAIGSLGIVFSLNPFDGTASWLLEGLVIPTSVLPEFLRTTIAAPEVSHLGIGILSSFLAFVGLGLGYYQFKNGFGSSPISISERITKISYNHFYLDRLYHQCIVKPGLWVGATLDIFDRKIVDALVNGIAVVHIHTIKELPSLSTLSNKLDVQVIDGLVNGIVGLFAGLARRLRNFQSGQLQQYLIWGILIMGVVFLISYVFLLE